MNASDKDIPPEPLHEEIEQLRALGLHVNWWPGAYGCDLCWSVLKVADLTSKDSENHTSFTYSPAGKGLPVDAHVFLGLQGDEWVVDFKDFMGPGRCRYFDTLPSAVSFVTAFLFDKIDPEWVPRRAHT